MNFVIRSHRLYFQKGKGLFFGVFLFLGLSTGILEANSYRVAESISHRNLTVYWVEGVPDKKQDELLTLQEAMENKWIEVKETGNVNQLSVQNLSQKPIFIQAGDVVKGGKQDRTLGTDLILTPDSGFVPIASFCVEQGRWSPRGNESLEAFSSSENQLVSKDLKLANRASKNQREVWSEVSKVQEKLNDNLKTETKSRVSPSSLQLALENKKVEEEVNRFTKVFLNKAQENKGTYGFVFSINGEINSADIYHSRDLFLKLWPKLIKASVVEAVAELNQFNDQPPPSVEEVNRWLDRAEKNNIKPVDQSVISSDTTEIQVESKDALFFESRSKSFGDRWVHRNLLDK